MTDKKPAKVLGAKTEEKVVDDSQLGAPAMISEDSANEFPMHDKISGNAAKGMDADPVNDKQYTTFEGEVVNKTDDYLDVKYSRNDASGMLDRSHFAVSRFGAGDVQSFPDVTVGDTNLRIAQSSLTETLLRYEDNKTAAE